MIYFAWIHPEEEFSPEKHLCHHELLLRASILHTEGHPAKLTLWVPQKKGAPGQDWGMLSYKKEDEPGKGICLFRGPLVEATRNHDGDQEGHGWILSFLGQAETMDKAWNHLAMTLKQNPAYEPLAEDGKWESLLSLAPFCLYWSRITGKLSLSHACKGANLWDLTAHLDPKSLIYHHKEPVVRVEIKASAQWIQTLQGYGDVVPLLSLPFPGKKIHTYTPKSLMNHWPKTGESFGRSGYYVVYSEIRECNSIPFRAPLESYPFGITLGSGKRQFFVKRTWLDAQLWIGYHYRQKRKEELCFSLKASLPTTTASDKTVTITIPFQKILQYEDLPYFRPMSLYQKGKKIQFRGHAYQAKETHGAYFCFDPERWEWLPVESENLFLSVQNSFFLTPRGILAFERLIERAKTALTWGTRCIEVQVRGPLTEWAAIGLDDAVLLHDDRIPGGTIQGKVIRYAMIADANQEEVQITLAGRVGVPCVVPSLPPSQPCYAIDYAQEEYQRYKNAYGYAGGVIYRRYDDQSPEDPLEALIRSQIFQIVHSAVHNLPQEQEAYLKKLAKEGQEISTAHLQGKETKIDLEFVSIHSTDQLRHILRPEILTSWFDPS